MNLDKFIKEGEQQVTVGHNVHFPFPNGWTLSLAKDTSGVGYSVAAFPTDDPPGMAYGRWFVFQEEGDRVFNLEEFFSRAREVANASPPARRSVS